ncbi:MAG TPA: DNA-3-methyladenine glycosylase [Candidatus Portnoybacteria bacterium]|nr:DNA-3-methyladenine glycosylase [Candidatus Portnoybacteria bacterium]
MLSRDFFLRPTIQVAKDLLGKNIIRQFKNNQKIIGKIVETEAYLGPKDRAAHSFGGKITPRNKIVYNQGGYIYIYLIYGMYWQLNFVTGQIGQPECILIRALEPIQPNSDETKIKPNGPGKLCQYLKLDKSFYSHDLCQKKKIWLEDTTKVQSNLIISTSRVNIDYAGPYWSRRKLRFYIKDNPWVSR